MPEQSNILQQLQQPVTAQNNSGDVGDDGEPWDDEDTRDDEDSWDDEDSQDDDDSRDDEDFWDDEDSWGDEGFDRGFPGVTDNEGFLGDEGYGGYGYGGYGHEAGLGDCRHRKCFRVGFRRHGDWYILIDIVLTFQDSEDDKSLPIRRIPAPTPAEPGMNRLISC